MVKGQLFVSDKTEQRQSRAFASFVRVIRVTGVCIAVLFALLVVADAAKAQPLGQLTMKSDTKREYIGAGRSWNVVNGSWSSQLFDLDQDGNVDFVRIYVDNVSTADGLFWGLDFGTNQLHRPMAPGSYQNAERASFAGVGHPGLDVGGDGRGCNTLTGSFEVHYVTIDYSRGTPRLTAFAASFVQYCEGMTRNGALRGTIQYRDDDGPITSLPYISSAKYKPGSDLLKLRGDSFLPGAYVEIDGTRYEPSTVKTEVLKIKNVVLAPGFHDAVVVNTDGGRSFPYQIAVYSKTQLDWDDPALGDLPEDDESDDSQ